MLCQPSADTVLEVLIFLVSRHMIIGDTSAFEDFVSIVSIALLFAIKNTFRFRRRQEKRRVFFLHAGMRWGMKNPMEKNREKYMRAAIREAKKAYALEEVPIGCVIVYQDKIIARGYNRRNTDKNTVAHAEMSAIKKASKKLGDWRLEGCTMYVTLEPCQMCAGAIVQARIDEVVIGSMNPKAGCAGSVLNLLDIPAFNHQVHITKGILEEECSQMLSGFFRNCGKKEEKQRSCIKM